MTTFEWIFPIWLLGVVVVLVILRQLVVSSTPLKAYSGKAAESEGLPRFRFVGGLRCRARSGGTITITSPLVRLTAHESDLRFGPSVRFLGVLVPRWTFPYSTIERAEPVSGSIGGGGVRIWVDGQPMVFSTSASTRVLDALESLGVAISRERRTTTWRSLG